MNNDANGLDLKRPCRYLFPSAHRRAGRRSRWHAAASLPDALSYLPKSSRHGTGGNGPPRLPLAWSAGGGLSSCWRPGPPNPPGRRPLVCHGPWSATGLSVVSPSVWRVSPPPLAAAPRAVFPPAVAIYGVRLACERPDLVGRSRSQGDGTALARQLLPEAIVEAISASTGRWMLAAHQLKPWRQPLGLSPTHPRDAAFSAIVAELIGLYTRPLRADALVLAGDEKTSRQPRPRLAPPLPAQPHHLPNRVAHAYKRAGALPLLAAFDIRAGKVDGHGYDRKRQRECIAVLDAVDVEVEEDIRTIHLVCDHVSPHQGQEVRQWLAHHPRFVMHFTPVHCSWMNQVEQWFSILQRKR
jgi:hypothetical protein